jgi:amino-acid N-acetyltransferase
MSSVDVVYRQATVNDVPGIESLIAPFVDAQKLLPRTRQELADLTKNGFVAECDHQIIGFASVDVYSRKLAELVCLAVSEHRQREGIGKRLVQQCIDRAKELGVLELMAISASDAFLKDCGFDYCLPNEKRALFYQTPANTRDQG